MVHCLSSSCSCVSKSLAIFLEDLKENFLTEFCSLSCQLVCEEGGGPAGVARAEYVDGRGVVPVERGDDKREIPVKDE